MQLGFGQQTSLTQTTATQQLQQLRRIQMMTVLQCQHQELQEYLEQEYEENPCLEIREKTLAPEDMPERKEVRQDTETERFDRLDAMGEDYSYFQEEYSRPSRSAQEEMSEKHQDWLENIPENPQTLPEFLYDQLVLLSLSPEKKEAVEKIIFSLDAHGFMSTPLEDLFGLDPEQLKLGKSALSVVQSLEPLGVGARNLKDSLLIQISARMKHPELYDTLKNPEEEDDNKEGEKPDYPAMQLLLTRYARDLESNSIPKIARESGMSVEKIYALLRQLSRLNPNPGRDFSPRGATVKPDLFCVQDENGKWSVALDESGIPDYYLNTRWGKCCQNDQEREFMHRKQNAAKWLLEAVQMRRETLLAVGNALIEIQADFLEKGVKALKPLTEKQLAEIVGKHPSTISRAVRGKWIQTPRGLFPLTDFFSASVAPSQTQAFSAIRDEESASRDAVQSQLLELIANEDKTQPLSDDQLATMLNVARTTINKYRKELSIPSSRQRRVYQ
ncbi:MAG: RNA polymerase factor sigma-54 [Planctomycetia bacterium]|nr:RNA polymerase factor sigma-54 [Planctomycetia bacterium]